MSAPYQANPVKRSRASRAEMQVRKAALFDILAADHPMTVRQVFYQATVKGIIEKTEAGYDKVQAMLSAMRWAGDLPFEWITDLTRWMRKPQTFRSAEEAIAFTAETYKTAVWTDTADYIEIWLEKEALAGVVYPITYQYDVPLMVAKGYASLSFLHGAAGQLAEQERPCFIYHFGDFDPSGVNAGEKIEETLRELAPDAEIHFERIAVTQEQIAAFNLPSRPTKASDSRSKNWLGGDSVELDAIPPGVLRTLVRETIERHISEDELLALYKAERAEREILLAMARGARR